MQIALTFSVVTWLGIVSWFDIRKREIPHSAWVVIPFIAALIYRTWHGGWQLMALAILVAVISERSRLAEWSHLPLDGWSFWIPLIVLFTYWGVRVSPVGALAILGFWGAWEFRLWGGADAVAAIILALLWPDQFLVLALLAVHLVAVVVATLISLIQEHRLRLHVLPGLPLLFVTVLVYSLLKP